MTDHTATFRPATRLLGMLTLLMMLFLASAVSPAFAQSCTNCGPKSPGPSGESPGLTGSYLGTLTAPHTRDLVLFLRGIDTTCGRKLDPRYRIDCLRATYVRLADQIPATGDYAPLRAALLDAARRLDAIVKANLDPALPMLRPRLQGKGGGRQIQPIRAVAQDKLRKANSQARKAVEDTSLLILRSGDRPPKRTVHYQQVAAAVEDNVILLRSG